MITLFISTLLVFAGPAEPQPYSQSYAILIKGELAGTEKVSEQPAGDGTIVSTSDHDLLVTDGMETKRMAFTTRMVSSKSGDPLSYSCKYTSGDSHDSYDVAIKEGKATRLLTRGGKSSEATETVDPGFVLLDFSVYHQYDFLLRKYDSKKGGRQVLNDYLPILGRQIPLAMTELERSNLDVSGRGIPLRNFRVEFVGIWTGTLSVDADGRLVRLRVPAQDLEVVRSDLVEKHAPGTGSQRPGDKSR